MTRKIQRRGNTIERLPRRPAAQQTRQAELGASGASSIARRELLFLGLGGWAACTGLLACGGKQRGPGKAPETLYSPEEAALFDDLLRPELFGIDQPGELPESDELLPDRWLGAEAVFSARVVTITRESGGSGSDGDFYSIVVSPTSPTLKGTLSPGTLVLKVEAMSPAYLWLEDLSGHLAASRLLLFVRRFAGELHFHATVDSAAVHTVLSAAKLTPQKAP